jgi:hypothetical protein
LGNWTGAWAEPGRRARGPVKGVMVVVGISGHRSFN